MQLPLDTELGLKKDIVSTVVKSFQPLRLSVVTQARSMLARVQCKKKESKLEDKENTTEIS